MEMFEITVWPVSFFVFRSCCFVVAQRRKTSQEITVFKLFRPSLCFILGRDLKHVTLQLNTLNASAVMAQAV